MERLSAHFPTKSTGSSKPTLCSLGCAEAVAALVLGSYRSTEVNNPAVYIRVAAAVMTGFPEEIVQAAFDPRSGLQTRQKWLPTVSEIRGACEAIAADRAVRERRAQLARHHVLIDTPRGLRPEHEVDGNALRLPGPPLDEPELTPQQRRERACERWENEVRPELVARRNGEPEKPKETPTTFEVLKRLAAEIGVTLTDADIVALPNAYREAAE